MVIVVIFTYFQGLFVQSKSTTTKEGQNVTLDCSASVKGGMWSFTTWFNGSQKLIKIGPSKQISIYSSRQISVVGQDSLRLYEVHRFDHGNYSCRALYVFKDNMSITTEDIKLLVKARPIIRNTSPDAINLTLSLQTRDLKIDCDVSAFPKANVTWKKGVRQLPADRFKQEANGALLITEASYEDSGTYACTASNELGTDNANFTVIVYEPPKIYGPRKFHANVGESARLICKSRGYPYASFTWSWKDPENKKVTISEGEEIRGYDVTTLHSHATSQSTLEISKVTKENWRMYTCEVVNSLSNDSALFTLSGKTRPESPTIIAVETSASEAVVKWKLGDNGGLELIALKLQYKEGSENTWQEIQIKPPNKFKHTIMDLQPDTSYKFLILATNSLGSSPPSATFIVKTSKMEASASVQPDKGFLGLPSNMTPLIAGVGGGFLAIIIMIIGIFYFVRKINKKNNLANTPVNSRPTSQQDPAERNSLLVHHVPNIPLPAQPEIPQGAESGLLCNNPWEFPRNRVDLQLVLGSGAFGLVMKAQAQGIKGCVGKMHVAVKIVKETDSETARRDLFAELELLKLIDPHPNVIGLLGCCTRQEPLMVIVEFCSYGDLQSYLRHCRGVEDKYYQDLYKVPIEKLGSRDLLSFAIQTARGMAHLAGMKVVHRDLAARNVLIDENKVCKVADFGFARDIYVEDHYTRKTQGGRFPIKWMAIESLLDGVSTSKSDVWSFGVVLWEIVTLGASPYPGMSSQEVINFLQDSYRMDKPKHCSEELYFLMLDCWQVAPQKRPTFTDLSQHLSKLFSDDREYIDMRMYEDHLYINFDKTSGTLSSKSKSKSTSASHQESAM